jgi:uncharacterized protein
MDPALAIQEYLEFTLGKLSEHPDSVLILRAEEGGRFLYRIRLHPEDAGRIIGRSGRTIRSIRGLAFASAKKLGIEVEIDLEDSRTG